MEVFLLPRFLVGNVFSVSLGGNILESSFTFPRGIPERMPLGRKGPLLSEQWWQPSWPLAGAPHRSSLDAHRQRLPSCRATQHALLAVAAVRQLVSFMLLPSVAATTARIPQSISYSKCSDEKAQQRSPFGTWEHSVFLQVLSPLSRLLHPWCLGSWALLQSAKSAQSCRARSDGYLHTKLFPWTSLAHSFLHQQLFIEFQVCARHFARRWGFPKEFKNWLSLWGED